MRQNLIVGISMLKDGVGKAAVQPYRLEVVTQLIRQAIDEFFSTANTLNLPFLDWDLSGKTVLVKPNWVRHKNIRGQGIDCLITHQAFVLAALGEVVKRKPKRIVIGDAPIQGCCFEEILSPEFCNQIYSVCADYPVEIIDFRRSYLTDGSLSKKLKTNKRSSDQYVLFDLGQDSLLEPISVPAGKFRVIMYDHRELQKTHHPGKHQYVLCREAFDADVIINLPKLKTHKKVCFSSALKNLVGLNGNKDYLPHHRVGGTGLKGDCYPGIAPLKRLAEYCSDKANQNIGFHAYTHWNRAAKNLLAVQKMFSDTEIEGGWYGNDTTWRMSLDLNRIVLYGKPDGTLADEPQRVIWSLTDGIISGQGEGPLSPDPLYTGAVTFSNSPAAADIIGASLMRLDWEKIPLLREALSNFRWPIAAPEAEILASYENCILQPYDVARDLGKTATPPNGWKGHCEFRVNH